MTTILIVDDSLVDQRAIAALLQNEGVSLLFAANGKEAVDLLQTDCPDLVLTDMYMPEMNGLELLHYIRKHYPTVPVILTTSKGSEDLAFKSLQAGAASYVPKRNLVSHLMATVQQVLTVARAHRDRQNVLAYVRQSEFYFVFGSEFPHSQALIGHVQEQMREMKLADEAELLQAGVALDEALSNAVYHGNLELSSTLREADGDYQEHARQRMKQPPYCNRHVHVIAIFTRDHAKFVIRDEGPGFDPSSLPDPTDPENIERVGGRGLLLIRVFMDEVLFNEKGNEITMVKRRKPISDEVLVEEPKPIKSPDLAVQLAVTGNVVLVTFTTDLSEMDYLRLEHAFQSVFDLLDDGRVANVLLDFRNTNYFGSSAVGLFMRFFKRTQDNDGQLALCNLSDMEIEILKTTCLDRIWPIFDSFEEALQFLRS